MKYISSFFAVIFGLIAFVYTIGYFEMIFGLISPTEIPVALEGTLEYFNIKTQLIGQDIGSILLIIVCIILSSFFSYLYRRLNKKKKDTFDKDSISAPFVLYLRSFVDDKTTKKRISIFNDVRTEEEVLVSVLSDIAPVYAIGDPKDKKMPLGASRIYVDDEHWKSTWYGYIFGSTIGVFAVLLAGLIRNIRALKDESKLKKLFIEAHDERNIQVQTLARNTAMQILLCLGLVATIISGYFSVCVSITIFVCIWISSSVNLLLIWYYNKKL